MRRLSDALRDEHVDAYEQALSADPAKLSEFRQVKAENTKPRLINERRDETTGY